MPAEFSSSTCPPATSHFPASWAGPCTYTAILHEFLQPLFEPINTFGPCYSLTVTNTTSTELSYPAGHIWYCKQLFRFWGILADEWGLEGKRWRGWQSPARLSVNRLANLMTRALTQVCWDSWPKPEKERHGVALTFSSWKQHCWQPTQVPP